MSFRCEAQVTVASEQLRAIMVAYQSIDDVPERDQLDVEIEEEPESFIVHFARGIRKVGHIFGGGGIEITCKISKRTFEIVSTSRSHAR